MNPSSDSLGSYIPWGHWDFVIARDGSWAEVTPDRSADGIWGYHINAVKLLEDDPCTDCLSLSNIHSLPNGDISIDVNIRHPYLDPMYTGFDVRGIIIFPASQYAADNELRAEAGYEPVPWFYRYARADKGDAVLVNGEGWTLIWAPEESPLAPEWTAFDLDEGLPIYDYYEGKYATGGEEFGNLNPFIRFYSNENRHMFEAGETVTRTYIIHRPAEGPIQAKYSVYAHWAPPTNTPVTNPAVDFPPEANSPLPFEFWVTQDAPIDPDKTGEEQAAHFHYHVKTWHLGSEYWYGNSFDLLTVTGGFGGYMIPHTSGEPDDYTDTSFYGYRYYPVPNAYPGTWPFIFRIKVLNPQDPDFYIPLGSDYYILNVDILEKDGN